MEFYFLSKSHFPPSRGGAITMIDETWCTGAELEDNGSREKDCDHDDQFHHGHDWLKSFVEGLVWGWNERRLSIFQDISSCWLPILESRHPLMMEQREQSGLYGTTIGVSYHVFLCRMLNEPSLGYVVQILKFQSHAINSDQFQWSPIYSTQTQSSCIRSCSLSFMYNQARSTNQALLTFIQDWSRPIKIDQDRSRLTRPC